MRISYKPFPLDKPSPAFAERIHWWPMLSVRLADRRLRLRTKAFYAVVDSGSSACLFHADFLKPLGMKLEDGIEDSMGGVGKGARISVFYHDVQILVGADSVIGVRAGFSEELSVAGILGRLGFFDSFRVTFDHSEHPPVLEIEKIKHKTVN